ncbi:hypothetical protein [Acinetobacter calcoaceticus]|uniref:hypothetical protein n=1 Tax=Acinetobacter calcoaceticus TaxID=471 RepID=UPI000FC1AFF7|nr:hypothetical protein [Acinetobacter calcoaceticus]WNY29652.1 hypothetical protein Q4S33_10615 [Acinetobacter calcoaceticus]
MKKLKKSFVICLILTTGGCATSTLYPPEPWSRAKERASLEPYIYADHIANLSALDDENARREYLDKLATAKIKLIDISYIQFKEKIKDNRKRSFFSNATTQILTTASTLYNPASTKTGLSAAAGLVAGLNSSSEKYFLGEKSIDFIISQMDAQRTMRAEILWKGLNDKDNNYTLKDLDRDLEMYREAGTIDSALQNIAKETAINSSVAEDNFELARYDYGADDNSKKIKNWLYGGGKKSDPQKRSELLEWLNKNNLSTIKIPVFLNGKYEKERAQFVQEKNL